MRFQYSCVYAPDIDELNFILDNEEEITYEEILEAIGEEEMLVLATRLGYNHPSLTIDTDWAVRFLKSKLPDRTEVYFVRHSAIEYIFY